MKIKYLMTFLIIFMLTTQTVLATVITTGSGTSVTVADGKEYGPSSGYEPKDSAKDIISKMDN